MSSRKPCINVSSMTYSGKEQSPLRFGISAEGFDINYKKIGYDNVVWKVKLKNNKKVWCRTTENDKEEDLDNQNEDLKTTVNETTSKTEEKEKTVKKITNYNLFLTYRLYCVKKEYAQENKEIVNKDIFSSVVKEWKSIDKKSKEFEDILKAAEEHHANANNSKTIKK